jgi:hypothetical protein
MSTKKIKISKNKQKQKSIRRTFVLFFLTFLSLLYTIVSCWCGRFDTPCMYEYIIQSRRSFCASPSWRSRLCLGLQSLGLAQKDSLLLFMI